VAEQLEGPFRSQGYEIKLEPDWAEFKAYRREWCEQDDEPLVTVAVGGVFPVGYFHVEEPSAYLALYLDGIPDDQPEQCRRFADLLYSQLGGRPAEWQDRTEDEYWFTPLWAAIPDTHDASRVALARNQQRLQKFVRDHYQKCFAIGDQLTAAVRQFSGK